MRSLITGKKMTEQDRQDRIDKLNARDKFMKQIDEKLEGFIEATVNTEEYKNLVKQLPEILHSAHTGVLKLVSDDTLIKWALKILNDPNSAIRKEFMNKLTQEAIDYSNIPESYREAVNEKIAVLAVKIFTEELEKLKSKK